MSLSPTPTLTLSAVIPEMNGTRSLKRCRSTGSVVYFVSPRMDYASFGDNPGMIPWSIYCVDVESKVHSSLLQPKVLLCDESFDRAAFCILESILYVFEGYEWIQGYETKCEGCRSIYSYELKPEDSNLKLSKSMMKKVGGSMNNVKYAPMAVPTPDGTKILVGTCLTNFDFELFDPKNERCEILPRINFSCEGSVIFSCAFLSKYVLLVQTKLRQRQQSFTLDLKAPQCCWEECLKFSKTPLQYRSLIFATKNICLTPDAGYYLDDGVAGMGWYLYPQISSLPEDFVSNYGAITLIAGEDEIGIGACEFCIFGLALEKEKTDEWNYTPHITLDVYRCDLNVCRRR